MSYYHQQTASFYTYLSAAIVGSLVLLWWFGGEMPLIGLLAIAMLVVCIAQSVRTLTVADRGDHLAVIFGPLPLFRKRINYADITEVEAGKSSVVDGWGIHYVPFRGWTYNLWGFDCAIIHLGRKVIRLGTDDVQNLVAFLQQKLHSQSTVH